LLGGLVDWVALGKADEEEGKKKATRRTGSTTPAKGAFTSLPADAPRQQKVYCGVPSVGSVRGQKEQTGCIKPVQKYRWRGPGENEQRVK
jgi:hypothetical protein